MKQSNYEAIIKCLQHGAPALANELIEDLNTTVEQANHFITLKQDHEKKQMQEKIDAERKLKDECTATTLEEPQKKAKKE